MTEIEKYLEKIKKPTSLEKIFEKAEMLGEVDLEKVKQAQKEENEGEEPLNNLDQLVEHYYRLITSIYDKEISDTFSGEQTKEELNMNLIKRERELNNLNRMKKIKDPNNIYNSKFDLTNDNDVADNLMEVEEEEAVINLEIRNNVNNYRLPVYNENGNIVLIRDLNKKIKAGGYDTEKVYESYATYAKGGLI